MFMNLHIPALNDTGALCAIGGARLGLHVLKRLPDKAVRAVVLTMLFLLGFRYLLS
jgi:uncharacterized membrane protein YfcA